MSYEAKPQTALAPVLSILNPLKLSAWAEYM